MGEAEKVGRVSGKYARFRQPEEIPTAQHWEYVWKPQPWESQFKLSGTGGAGGENQDAREVELG